MDNEALARFLAERINGGDFYDKRWYNEEQRELWHGHAEVTMKFIQREKGEK